jgi:hypothetical protein
VVGNADELYAYHNANGLEIVEALGDRPYGLRDYRVRDLHGYVLGFGHQLFNAGPPLEIERVDVSVRLEKRLRGSSTRSRTARRARQVLQSPSTRWWEITTARSRNSSDSRSYPVA